jgi:chromosome segregation ATPase
MSETDRIRDVIRKNETRIADLTKSIEAVVNSFSEESKTIIETVDKIDAQLQAADERITTHDSNISNLEEKKQNLKAEVTSLEQKVRELDKKITSLTTETGSTSKDLMKAEETLKQHTTKIQSAKSENERLERAVSEIEQNTEKTRTSYDKEFQERRTAYEDAQKRARELTVKEPVADFLLTEATQEPTEIAIIAQLVKAGGIGSVDELKKAAKVPPALAVRTILSLEQKEIIVREGPDKIKLAKAV